MIISRNIGFAQMGSWATLHLTWLAAYMAFIAALYKLEIFILEIPWIAVTVIGTAVAFYLGFKNNQSYDRLWEARKIWGGIVNESRTWGMMVDGYVSNLFAGSPRSEHSIQQIKTRLIHRHIAWLYTHRTQLLIHTAWEHGSQAGRIGVKARREKLKYGVGAIVEESNSVVMERYLSPQEIDHVFHGSNPCTRLMNEQSKLLAALRSQGLIDDFRHTQMIDVIRSIYTLQGQNERIKKFPLPRQYANISRYFVGIFIFILPLSLIPEMALLGTYGLLLSIPVSTLVAWIYLTMELVGDYSENPFSSMPNDIPMLSLCRTIEIDLLEILGEANIPQPIEAKNGILM